jgi:hypothetical protein
VEPLPDVALLRQLFTYNPDTGEVINRYTRKGAKANCPAGSTHPRGYIGIAITVGGVKGRYYLHRIAYALHHGIDPYPCVIDHINRNPTDNRACNLRAVSQRENIANTAKAYKLKPVRITYPDGGTITCRSITAATFVLQLPRHSINRTLCRANGHLCYKYKNTGIRIEYA